MKGTFTEAAQTFLDSADWLTEEDEPAVTGLFICAQELDRQFMAATFAQYQLTYRYLMKSKPKEQQAEETDPDLQEL